MNFLATPDLRKLASWRGAAREQPTCPLAIDTQSCCGAAAVLLGEG
jgi:hypothetical protein